MRNAEVARATEDLNRRQRLATSGPVSGEELQHALVIAKQIDYLGGTPVVVPKPVKLSDDPKALLRFDLNNEAETIRAYRSRVRQCEALGEYAMAEHIREILMQEQEHLIDLATALGQDPPDLSE